jgi:ABC-2 type transport system ATP-binding protein
MMTTPRHTSPASAASTSPGSPASASPASSVFPPSVSTPGAAPAALAVEAHGLTFRYGSFTAVDAVDLAVPAGGVFALLGTNGAGKTTTLEVLQGYRRAAAGEVRVLGLDPVRDRATLKRRTGVMLQEAGFIAELTVGETLALWASLSSRHDDVDDLLEQVELSHRRDVAVESLSGGERRRLDVAVAVWGRPELVVLDEPTTGLDPESRRRLWRLVTDLRDAGTTIVLTTHYLEEAEALADGLAIMHRGRVAVAGTLEQVLRSRPARLQARVPADHLDALPDLAGELDVTLAPDGRCAELRVRTTELQSSMTDLLLWARARGLDLDDLRATPASLEDVFHAVRAADDDLDADTADRDAGHRGPGGRTPTGPAHHQEVPA